MRMKQLTGWTDEAPPLTLWWEPKMAAGTLSPDDCRRMSDEEIDIAVANTKAKAKLRPVPAEARTMKWISGTV
jgi:hypothetical protein